MAWGPLGTLVSRLMTCTTSLLGVLETTMVMTPCAPPLRVMEEGVTLSHVTVGMAWAMEEMTRDDSPVFSTVTVLVTSAPGASVIASTCVVIRMPGGLAARKRNAHTRGVMLLVRLNS